MTSRRRFTTMAAVAAATVIAQARPARAENPAGVPDPVAQALFQDGRDLVDKGEWSAGCTKFEASMLLYPAASTLLNIARCHEHDKKLASAWSTYKRAQVLNRETVGEERKRAIDDLITQQIAALTPRLPRIKLVMKRAVLGATLRKDGEVLPPAVVGTDIPVDVGEHEIAAEAPGHLPFRLRFDVAEGTSREVAIELVSETDAAAHDAGASVPTWAWVSGGASLLLLGASAGFRIDQAFVEGRQSGLCGGDVQRGCPVSYDPDSDNTRKNIDFGLSVGFGLAGAVALAASIYGVVRGAKPDRSPKVTLVVPVGGAGFGASFRF